MVDKIREAHSPSCTNSTSPPSLPSNWLLLDKTPMTTKDMRESMFNQLVNRPIMSEKSCNRPNLLTIGIGAEV